MPMTPQQRRNAALKAAATKRRNQAARSGGYAPPPTPPPSNTPMHCRRCGTVYPAGRAHTCVAPPNPTQAPPNPWAPGGAPTTPPSFTSRPAATTVFGPKPTVENARAEVIVALENLYALVVKESGMTTERDDAFRKYKLALNTALGQLSNQAMQNEANAALCVAAIRLWKVTF
jgi:hypothetical protein